MPDIHGSDDLAPLRDGGGAAPTRTARVLAALGRVQVSGMNLLSGGGRRGANAHRPLASDTGDDHDDHGSEDDGAPHEAAAPGAAAEGDDVALDKAVAADGPAPAPAPAPRVFSKKERRRVVASASFAAFLHPLATSVYTPVLPIIQNDLQCSDAELMITVSAYLVVLGFMPMVWGPVSDVYGRRSTILLSTAVFCATSIACGFAWNVESLIAMRVLQAFGSSACLTVGAGAIADTHEPAIRGAAMGIYLLGPLVGPVLGPTLGGFITQYLGWRSTTCMRAGGSIFFVLGGMAVLAFVTVFVFMPESLAPPPPGVKRKFPNPFSVFGFFRYAGVASCALMASWAYAAFYAMVILVPRTYVTVFGLEPQIVGLVMIPSGLGTMMGSVVGGRVADRAARGRSVDYRLIPTTLGQLAFVPGLILLGWLIDIHVALTVLLYAFCSFFFTFPRPGLTTYAIEIAGRRSGRQSAGAINGLLYSVMYLAGGISSQVSAAALPVMGMGWFFTTFAVTLVPVVGVVIFIMMKGIRLHRRAHRSSDRDAEGGHELAALGSAAEAVDHDDEDDDPGAAFANGKDALDSTLYLRAPAADGDGDGDEEEHILEEP